MKNTKFIVLLVLSFIFVFVLANAFAADETLALVHYCLMQAQEFHLLQKY